MDIGTLTGSISLEDQLSGQLSIISSRVKQFADSFSGSMGVIGVSAVAITVAIGSAIGSIVALGVKGSTILGVEQAFDRLARAAGSTGDALVGALSEGVRDTIDSMELMQATSRLLSSGFKLNVTDAKLLGQAAREMGKATGTDAAGGLKTLSDALLTGRTRGLSMAGIVVNLKDAEEKFAKSLGTTASQLNETGKLEAKRIAILDATRAYVDRLGISQLSFKERIQQASVAVGDWFDKLAKGVASSKAVNRAFDTITDAFDKAFGGDSQKLLDVILSGVDRFANAVSRIAPPVIQAVGTIKDAVVGAINWLAQMNDKFKISDTIVAGAKVAWGFLKDAFYLVRDAIQAVIHGWASMPDWLQRIAVGAVQLGAGLAATSLAMNAVATPLAGLVNKVDQAINIIGNLSGSIYTINALSAKWGGGVLLLGQRISNLSTTIAANNALQITAAFLYNAQTRGLAFLMEGLGKVVNLIQIFNRVTGISAVVNAAATTSTSLLAAAKNWLTLSLIAVNTNFNILLARVGLTSATFGVARVATLLWAGALTTLGVAMTVLPLVALFAALYKVGEATKSLGEHWRNGGMKEVGEWFWKRDYNNWIRRGAEDMGLVSSAASQAADALREEAAAFKTLQDSITGKGLVEDVRRLDEVLKSLGANPSHGTLKRIAAAGRELQERGGTLTPQIQGIVNWLGRIDGTEPAIELDKVTGAVRNLRTSLDAPLKDPFGPALRNITGLFTLPTGPVVPSPDPDGFLKDTFKTQVEEQTKAFAEATLSARVFEAVFRTLTPAMLANAAAQDMLIAEVDKLANGHRKISAAMMESYTTALSAREARLAEGRATMEASGITLQQVNAMKLAGRSEQNMATMLGVTSDAFNARIVVLRDVQRITDEVTKSQNALVAAQNASQMQDAGLEAAQGQRAIQQQFEQELISAEAFGTARIAIEQRYNAARSALELNRLDTTRDLEIKAFQQQVERGEYANATADQLLTMYDNITQRHSLTRIGYIQTEAERIADIQAKGATEIAAGKKAADRAMVASHNQITQSMYDIDIMLARADMSRFGATLSQKLAAETRYYALLRQKAESNYAFEKQRTLETMNDKLRAIDRTKEGWEGLANREKAAGKAALDVLERDYGKTKLQLALDESAAAAEEARSKIATLAESFEHLGGAISTIGQNWGGTLGGVLVGIGGITAAWGQAIKQAKIYEDRQYGITKMEAGAALVGGAVAVAGATSSGSTGSRVGQGAAAGAAAGVPFAPVTGGASILVGAGIGALVGYIRGHSAAGKAAKAANLEIQSLNASLVASHGTLKNATELAAKFGITLDTTVSGVKGLANLKTQMTALDAVIQALNADLQRYNLTWEDLIDKQSGASKVGNSLVASFKRMTTAGYTSDAIIRGMSDDLNDFITRSIKAGTKIPVAMKPIVEQLITMGMLTEQNANLMLGLADSAMPSLQSITEAADRYGISLDQLGPKVKQLQITELANQYVADWQVLTAATNDWGVLFDKMGPKVQSLILDAIKYGSVLPASMRPMLQAWIDQGKLVDESGAKLTDLTRLTFAKDLSEMFEGLITKLDELIEKITVGVGGALGNIGNTVVRPHIKPIYDSSDIPDDMGAKPREFSEGGVVKEPIYAAVGTVVPATNILPFKPKGTDVVPAMLTPGERVLTVAQNAAFEQGQMPRTIDVTANVTWNVPKLKDVTLQAEWDIPRPNLPEQVVVDVQTRTNIDEAIASLDFVKRGFFVEVQTQTETTEAMKKLAEVRADLIVKVQTATTIDEAVTVLRQLPTNLQVDVATATAIDEALATLKTVPKTLEVGVETDTDEATSQLDAIRKQIVVEVSTRTDAREAATTLDDVAQDLVVKVGTRTDTDEAVTKLDQMRRDLLVKVRTATTVREAIFALADVPRGITIDVQTATAIDEALSQLELVPTALDVGVTTTTSVDEAQTALDAMPTDIAVLVQAMAQTDEAMATLRLIPEDVLVKVLTATSADEALDALDQVPRDLLVKVLTATSVGEAIDGLGLIPQGLTVDVQTQTAINEALKVLSLVPTDLTVDVNANVDEVASSFDALVQRVTTDLGGALADVGNMVIRPHIKPIIDEADRDVDKEREDVPGHVGGGKILAWTPRGSDTVPAMLTPGETVVPRGESGREQYVATIAVPLNIDGEKFAEAMVKVRRRL